MFSLRSSRGVTAALKPVMQVRAVKSAASQASRTFSILTPLRPSLQPRALTRAPTSVSCAAIDSTTTTSASSSEILDLLPKISTHPSLVGIQVRCGPRNTFSPSHFVRKRRHGFLSRLRTRKGRATLQRRKSKNRSTLSH
ncbi:hypothetical protein VC83_02990 [Pseudogymnoascus destructans]|uniref:Large ribosomal subunit protein bL34m n=2 Tax=Pseudogymnoascus destructans TaxID=655981 RepID=L8GAW5_PSED2|nr:uncharacterized protein VC83_02990 [Pseudogymnoascus destructans]ELR10212.1 hypothetical protein GMDG_04605 [Pseudogymnoascus destructans 20631-21]OAF60056.1 hypothetical protein VC83_02990 [Pseudogymnoascus destructans]